MAISRYVEVDGTKVFKEEIEKMDKNQVKMICSFLSSENDLRFVQEHCDENYKYLIDNILFTLK